MAAVTVAQLAEYVGGALSGDGTRCITRCAGLDTAGATDVSFLSNPRYGPLLETTQAGCVILAPDVAARLLRKDVAVISAQDPYYAFRQAVVRIHGHRCHPRVGVSPLAVVHESAEIAPTANVHPFAVIGEGVSVGENTQVYPGVTLMARARIGDDCILYPSVTIYEDCVLGNRVIVHAGSVVGTDGYGFATHGGAHHKIPQVGNAVLEDDVELGANVVIERAALDSTTIGRGSKLGDGVVIGHNTIIGPHNLLVPQVGIAGSVTTGKYVVMGGQVGVAGHLSIADMTRIAAQSGVMVDIEEPGHEWGGTPALEAGRARRVYFQFTQLPELAKRLKDLEAQVKKLTAERHS